MRKPRRLTALEESLGARLFQRTPEGLIPTDAAVTIPTVISLLGEAVAISASGHSCALLKAGTLECWGYTLFDAMTGIEQFKDVKDFSTGTDITCVITVGTRYPSAR